MKILHTADIHLQKHDDERWKALQGLIAVGKKEQIALLLISGDLFDKGIDAEMLRPAIRELFSNSGFQIVLIPGNHDMDSYAGGKYFGEDTVVLTDMASPFVCGEVMVWGIPFEQAGREETLYRIRSLAPRLTPDKRHILLYHGELLDAFFSRKDFGSEGNDRYMPIKLSYFTGVPVDYVLAGHFHSRFDVWKLDTGGYFVYPGSPIAITKRETGQRKVNLFEVGKPPQEFSLDTPHFEEVVAVCDPLSTQSPIEIVQERLTTLHPQAKIILTVTGFINGEALGMSEEEMAQRLKKVLGDRSVEEHYEFRDIRVILEDDLFKGFLAKLEESDYDEELRGSMRDLALRALMEARG